MNKIPYKLIKDDRNEFLFREEGNGLLIQGTHVLYLLNHWGYAIYKKIDGRRNIKEIIEELKKEHKNNKISEDVNKFIIYLNEKKLIDFL